jgi:PAS domain S-box-containing protein
MGKPTYEELENRIEKLEKAEIKRIEAGETLRKSEHKYREIVDSTPISIFECDITGRLTYVNKHSYDLFGYNIEDFENGLNALEMIAHADKKRAGENIRNRLQGNLQEDQEYTAVKKDGPHFKVLLYSKPIIQENRVTGLRGFLIDITRRIEAEEALKSRENWLNSIFRVAPVGIGVVSNRVFKFVNDRLCEMIGYSEEELIGKNSAILYQNQKEHERVGRIKYNQVAGRTGTVETKFKRKDGEFVDVLLNFTPLNLDDLEMGITFTALDVTENKKAENAIRESENKYKELFNNANDAIYLWEVQDDQKIGKCIETNEIACRMLGYTREEFLQMTPADINAEETITNVPEIVKLLLEKGSATFESVHKTKGGKKLHVEVSSHIFDLAEKKVIMSISRNISKRKQTEQDLQRTRFSIEQAVDSIYWINHDGTFLDVNESACRELGYSKEELLLMGVKDIVLEDPQKYAEEIWPQRWDAIKANGSFRFESQHKRKDGSTIPVEISINYAYFSSQEYVVAFSRDITERKNAEEEKNKLEQQLFQSQKMESIGRLAGGIAHDFNNILTSILGYAEILTSKFNDYSMESNAANIIMLGAERAANLTKQLLGFARGGKYNPLPLNVNKVINDTITVSEKIFEKSIVPVFNLEENTSYVEADETQLNQVFTNIIFNAKDAMPNGGKIIINTLNYQPDNKFLLDHPEVKSRNYVQISFTDTGSGMTKSVLDRVFEPFFTTKEKGRGTGLGMATVYGIIKNHDGHVYIDSKLGKGTTVSIYLPATNKELIVPAQESKVFRGMETILVVDDEENVRRLLKDMLQDLGYKVVLAEDGDKAVEIYRMWKKDIDLILLDMIMPNLTGRETFLEFLYKNHF